MNSPSQRYSEESQSWTSQVFTLSLCNSWRTSNTNKITLSKSSTSLISSWQGPQVQYPLELTSFASLFWSTLCTTKIQLFPLNFITSYSRRSWSWIREKFHVIAKRQPTLTHATLIVLIRMISRNGLKTTFSFNLTLMMILMDHSDKSQNLIAIIRNLKISTKLLTLQIKLIKLTIIRWNLKKKNNKPLLKQNQFKLTRQANKMNKCLLLISRTLRIK